jgi:diacylglycerol kinase family enzyme
MYYYVLEQQPARAMQRFREQLTDLATDQGIAGEMVTQSSLKGVEDLIELGVKKGYTTIVAVGSDRHITRVMTALMHRRVDQRPVLGTIPTDKNSPIGAMVGIPTLRHALQALKLRHLAYATLAEIEPGKFLLTSATIHSRKPTLFEIAVDTARLEVAATEITVSGDGHIEIRNARGDGSSLARGLAWLMGATLERRSTSLLQGQRIRIGAATPMALSYGHETLAKTPLVLEIRRRALKIVVARANLSVEEE